MMEAATPAAGPAGAPPYLPLHPRVRRALDALHRDRNGEPNCAYVYDLVALRHHAAAMRAALPAACSLFYAVKANAEVPILRALAPLVDGFEVASGGELAWLRRHCPGVPLLFGGPGKLETELRAALAGGIEAIHVESLGELERLGAIAASLGTTAPVMLRLNLRLPNHDRTRLVMGGVPSPFGLDETDLDEAAALLRAHPAIRLDGLHVHALSHQLDTDAHLRRIAATRQRVREIARAQGWTPSVLNCGGGMGVSYLDPAAGFDWTRFCDGLRDLLADDGGGMALRFEPGRLLAATCGTYVMEVLDLKRSHGEWFAVGRGGTHHFRLPAAQNHDHPVRVVDRGGTALVHDEPVTVVGQLCTPKDVLTRRCWVASLAVGDQLAFPLAGAYGWTISHRDFLMHPPPQVVFLDEGEGPAGSGA